MRTITHIFVSLVVLFSLMATPVAGLAKNASPFTGGWFGLDIDGGEMRLAISGPGHDVFRITWTEEYLGFCQGGPGIVRGTGALSADDAYLLFVTLEVECFKTGETLQFFQNWVYQAGDNTIAAYDEAGHLMTTWHRQGTALPQAEFAIIAHPDENWVEGLPFVEGAYVRVVIFDDQHNLLWSGEQESFWEEDTIRANFYPGEEYQLQPGDQVWMNDGITVDGMVITNLTMNEPVDLENWTVSGRADPGSEVIIEYFTSSSENPQVLFAVPAGEDGNWTASIAGMLPGTWALVSQDSSDNDLTRLAFYLPNPHFTVFPEWEWFDAMDWPEGTAVSISVEGPDTACSLEVESPGNFFNGSFGEGCDVKIGDTVTFSGGGFTRTHEVRNLAVTETSDGENWVLGTSGGGETVYVWAHQYGEQVIETMPEGGAWGVDFDDVGVDLQPGMDGRSEIRDEAGNATAVDWHVSNPRFTVYPQWEWLDGWDWPAGAMVEATVADKPDCAAAFTAGDGSFAGTFGEGCDLIAGDVVTLFDGTTTRTHTVGLLTLTAADPVANTLSGMADANQTLWLWPNENGDARIEVTADGAGSWTADVTGVFDLEPGTRGMGEFRDAVGNGTAVDWNVPDPRLVVNTDENWVILIGFLPDSDSAVTVFEADGETLAWESVSINTDGSGFRWVDVGVDLVAGMYVTVTDGTNTRAITLEALTFDSLDLATGQASGTATGPAEREVWVGIGLSGGDIWSQVGTTGEGGGWTVNFGESIPSDYAWAAAQIFDEDGDATEVRPAEIVPAP